MHFADTLIERVRAVRHPLCVGLDPHLDRIPKTFRRGSMAPADPETAQAAGAFLGEVVDRIEGRVAIVKPQIALFEQLGWPGIRMLTELVARCRLRGLQVLLDAKRGDIGSTAEGYAAAYLEPHSPLAADALTVNPYLGLDTLDPYFARCEAHGRGVFVLVKTSNPGSGDLQDRWLGTDGDKTLFETVAELLAGACAKLRGHATGWSSLGVVVGATYPEQAERVRERLPDALFLVPGFGEQGADAAAAVRGFREGPFGLEGGVVSSSRAVLFPKASGRGWETDFEAALDEHIHRLGSAIV